MYVKATARVKLITSEATKSFSRLFFCELETKMAEHETGVSLMDATLNMMMLADDIVLLSTSARGRENI